MVKDKLSKSCNDYIKKEYRKHIINEVLAGVMFVALMVVLFGGYAILS